MKSENLLALCEKTFKVFPVLFHYFSHFKKLFCFFFFALFDISKMLHFLPLTPLHYCIVQMLMMTKL